MFFERFKTLFYQYLGKSLLLVLAFLLFFNFVKASKSEVVINEVAWMGTTIDKYNEWIELKNLSDEDIDLGGWTLETEDGGIEIELEGEIKAGEFFLLERTDDDSVKDEKADLIYTGGLSNSGEVLILKDVDEDEIDKVDAEDDWPSGDNNTKQTMERIDGGDWQDSFVIDGTPCEKNSTKDDKVKSTKECLEKNRPGLKNVKLNEIFPNPLKDEDKNEWIEIINLGDGTVNLEGCFLADGNYDPEEKNIKKGFVFDEDEEIDSGEYKVIKRTEFKFGMNNGEEIIYFLDETGEILDKISYENTEEDFSYALNNKNNWQWTEILTPEAVNQFPVPKIYSKKLEITELMPNPEGNDNDNEWVELFNSDEVEIELEDWYFLNQGGQKFKLDGLKIKSTQRLKIEIKNTSFSIKNSDGRIELFDPNDESVDKVSYSESFKENSSLNKNSEGQWLRSIFSTPGEENKFNNPPTYKVDIPDEIYEDVKTEFKIKKVKDRDGEDLKYRWDFGDDHKSYLKETTHIFSQKGKYNIQTRVSDLSVDIFKNFRITVKKFPKLDLRIIKILPNPEGPDSDNEKIWIENREKNTINLKGWIVATGKNMNSLVNHYVKDNFKIKSGEVKILEREDCPFSLLNQKGRVVLKSPNGEIVNKIKYEKEKIAKDELYYLDDKVWKWEAPVVLEVKNPQVLGESVSSQIKIASGKQPLFVINQILSNPYFNRTDRFKLLFFDNWLFAQSQGYFFEFLFPEYLRKRFES